MAAAERRDGAERAFASAVDWDGQSVSVCESVSISEFGGAGETMERTPGRLMPSQSLA